MDFFKKDKMPSKKKNGKKKENKKLSKYLPSILFVGIQEDVNEKALIGYITSLSQSAFSNVKEVKYSIKKLGKNRFIYEVHNGSKSLTYIPLVVSTLIEGRDKEVVLKTNSQNVRVVKKTATKIESNTLIESNNRDEDARIDYNSSGKLKLIVKEGSAIFMFSAIAASITSVLASASFISKYYMLNEDYSYDPEIQSVQTAHDYLMSLPVGEHSKYKYLKNIRYKNNIWVTEYTEVIPPPEPEEIEPVEIPIEQQESIPAEMHVEQQEVISAETHIKQQEVVPVEMHVEQQESIPVEVPIEQQEVISAETHIEQQEVVPVEMHIEQQEVVPAETHIEQQEVVPVEMHVEQQKVVPVEMHVEQQKVVPAEMHVEQQEIVPTEIPVEQQEMIPAEMPVEQQEMIPAEMPVEQQEMISTEIPVEQQEVKAVESYDEFEIMDEKDLSSLNLSDLPENVILEDKLEG